MLRGFKILTAFFTTCVLIFTGSEEAIYVPQKHGRGVQGKDQSPLTGLNRRKSDVRKDRLERRKLRKRSLKT